MAAKLHACADNLWVFHCPGCEYGHAISVNGRKNESGATWTWNGSIETPTFTPSLLVSPHDAAHRCHSFVKDGQIQFLADCCHKLKGQTVPIPDWDE